MMMLLPILQLVVLVWIAVLIREVVLRLNTILAHQAAADLLASRTAPAAPAEPTRAEPAPPPPVPAAPASDIREILRTPVGRELLRARLEARLKRQAREGPPRGD